MIGAVAALLLPAVAAWRVLLASGVRTRQFGTPQGSAALTGALAFCCGLGASSLTAFWWVVAAGGIGPAFVATDAALWIGVAALAWRRGRIAGVRGSRSVRVPLGRVAVWAVFAAVAIIAVATAMAEHRVWPYGQADATLIWNLKARFMLHGGDAWSRFAAVPWASPSHPLLVSASVARMWAYGGEAAAAPFVLGIASAAAIVAAIVGAIGAQWRRAWVAGTLVMAPWPFSQSAAAQLADLPLALYVVVSLIALTHAMQKHPQPPSHPATHPQATQTTEATQRAWLLAGLLAGLAAWTKNEGVVVLAVLGLMAVWFRPGHGRAGWLAFVAGAAPAILAVAWVKLVLAPVAPEYFVASSTLPAAVDAGFAAHASLVTGLAFEHWARWGAPGIGLLPVTMAAAAVVAATRNGTVARRALTVVAAALAAYYAVWLQSPLDPAWLVSTTADRLFLHIWPAVVLAACSAPLPWLTAEGNLVR